MKLKKLITISSETVHKMPPDLKKKLSSTKESIEIWEDITPLARNEFICWVVSAKKLETRERRVERTFEELVLEGKRRPCCWAGCPHRLAPN
ncbi:MAG: YdeI/OmpD-associated family protein [bacterium]|nr:YdeI/OmpD-associated family protein [bacterium]